MGIFSFFSKEKKEKLDQGLEKTKTSLFDKISKALVGKSSVDDAFLDDLEEILVSSDVGIETTLKIIDRLQKRVATDKYVGVSDLNALLKEEVGKLMEENKSDIPTDFSDLKGVKPYVVMVVGVNGVGKTTTIGKMANQYKKVGKKVVLGAGDTFRAAAVEQLKLWGTMMCLLSLMA
jgi:fused signal recognition particle receptor